jgi:crossover junction endodeoxyribonuclease RusA
MITIVAPIDNRLHAHAKGHWREKAQATKQARQLAMLLASGGKNRAIAGKCVVDYLFFVPDKRRRDAANLVQSAKPLIDGVVDAKMISGDHWEVLSIGKVDVVLGDKLEVQLTFRAA